jgi:hypothetical protein
MTTLPQREGTAVVLVLWYGWNTVNMNTNI